MFGALWLMKRTILVLTFCILLLGCSELPPTADNPPPAKTEPFLAGPVSLPAPYWDGWPYLDQPVYSYSAGPSAVAHADFIECGLGDEYIEKAVRSHVANSKNRISKSGIMEVNADQESIWAVSIEVTELTPDIFLVLCSGKRP
jgi:hypothetical protein